MLTFILDFKCLLSFYNSIILIKIVALYIFPNSLMNTLRIYILFIKNMDLSHFLDEKVWVSSPILSSFCL